MRKLFAVVFLTLASGIYKAQETLPYYQQYFFDGEFLFNPAFYGSTDDFHLNMNYQKQYSKFSESPNVQSLGAHANIFDRVGAGLTVFRDENGPISSNGITAGASYFIPLSDVGEREDQFSFGTSVSAYNMNFDYSQINTDQGNDPLINGEESSIFMVYANFGLQAAYKHLKASASVNDIALSSDQSIVNGIEPSPIKIFLNLGYDWHLTEGMYLSPSILMNLNTNSSRMMDYNLMGTVYNDYNKFSLGASFRVVNNRFDNQSLSISPIVKVNCNRWMFGASYNIGMSDIQDFGGNSFMLGLGYNFNNFINVRGFRY